MNKKDIEKLPAIVESVHIEKMAGWAHGTAILADDGRVYVAAMNFSKSRKWKFEKVKDKWIRIDGYGPIPEELYQAAKGLMK